MVLIITKVTKSFTRTDDIPVTAVTMITMKNVTLRPILRENIYKNYKIICFIPVRFLN